MSEENPEILAIAQSLASSGFRDTSRVGGGNPELGLMMAQYNKEALRQSLCTYQQKIEEVIVLIEENEWSKIESLLFNTQISKKSFMAVRKGREENS